MIEQKIKLFDLFSKKKFSELELEIEAISDFKTRSSFLANLLGVAKLSKESNTDKDWFEAKELFKDSYQKDPDNVLALQEERPEQFQIILESMVADRIQALTEELVNEETMTQQKDPLVALKQQELDLRAMDMQRRGEEFNVEEIRKRQEFMERMNLEQMERDDANAQAKERIRVADEKLDIAAKKVTGGK